jgi:phosphodiesterase/alkaline phosphatase D-like protein
MDQYVMSYIKFSELKPRTNYTYKVKSGGTNAEWSAVFKFRSVYADASVTRVLTYGDMGHSKYNCMWNAQKACEQGAVDAIVHVRFIVACCRRSEKFHRIGWIRF